MATYVLVPGFWLGGWAWDDVAAELRAAGHEVHAVTLTGLDGEQRPGIGLATHVDDVIAAVGDRGDVILVGHSGGGMPVTVAADRIPDRLAKVVYVDSGALPDGMAQLDTNPPEVREELLKLAAEEGPGFRIPPPAWQDVSEDPGSLAGLTPAMLKTMRERAVPEPFGPARDEVRRSGLSQVPEVLIACTFPKEAVEQMLAAGHPFFAGFRKDLQIVYLPTGHWPMFSRPADTAHALAKLAD